MSDIVKRLRDIFNVVDAELGGSISNVISEAADTIEIITSPDVDNKSFWRCLDRFQEVIDADGYFFKDDGVDPYTLFDANDNIVADGSTIREMLVNLVMSEC